MDTHANKSYEKSYKKYKFIVKKWEKDFIKKNGRIPSKHDIKEAAQHVRTAYKHYFNLKSEILETSLMDATIDDEMSTFNEFDVSGVLEFNSESFNELEDTVFHTIPSTNEIETMMNQKCVNLVADKTTPNVSDKIWGSHLNNKIVEMKKETKTSFKNFPTELFKSCSFNKRNPRKSLSSCKSQSSSTEISTQIIEKNTSNEIIEKLEANFVKESTNIKTQHICTPLNPVQAVLSQATSSVRNIDIGWLDRCTGSISSEANCSSNSTLNTENNMNVANLTSSGVYGLKNLQVCPIISTTDDAHHSDFVANSESENELPMNKSTSRKIRPVVKKAKLDINIPTKTSPSSALETQGPASPTQKSEKKASVGTKRAMKRVNKPNPEKKEKSDKDIESKYSTGRPTRRSRVKKRYQDSTTDSENDDTTQVKRVTKPKRIIDSKKPVTKPKNQDIQYENEFLGEQISQPRFPINSSLLQESSLVDGLTAALKLPKHSKPPNANKVDVKNLHEEDKIQKKINDGTLNDNFIKINIEKKVFVRGKRGVNYSKFKKQQWKNKKKMLHSAPEFPTGGVLKCFKCDQTGHMARYCKAGRAGELLPLKDCEENSPHISLHQAQALTNKLDVPKVSQNFNFECIEKIEENDQQPTQGSSDNSSIGIQPISETFIKLLATRCTSTSAAQRGVDPLYPLSSDALLMPTPGEVQEALLMFGHSDFRNGQETAVMRILSGLSTLVTLSTGSGKSLCYQLPAYLYAKHNKCITLVISPLVSLMEDQVTSMPNFLNAGCLHTNQSPTQREKIVELIKNGDINILLVSPEAIVAGERSTGFGAILRQLPPIAFACIDEVHCVSQWSHNFRPSYLMICRVLREKLGVKCVLGLTATATIPTMAEIVQHLDIHDGIQSVITNKPLPDNLILTVSRDSQRDRYLLELLESERFSQCNSVIVYCIRRDECERVASLIRSALQGSKPIVHEGCNTGSKKRKRFSWIVEAYHAGMSAAKRLRVQKSFMCGDLRIVVATVAFGMGINKSDIRGVIHYNMPSSFESYVQEVGRAGRDGLPAQCHVFIDSEFRDKDELLRHIHANSIERHVIRKLLQRVFLPCECSKMIKGIANENSGGKCQGHEVAFSIDETVSELDVPPENISTLLCYLELHPNKYAKVLTNVYIMCKIISYGGLRAILKAAEKCPPLAMAIALRKKAGMELEDSGNIEFCVIEVAAALGWESGVVKYHLKNLEWETKNGLPKKSPLRVEFNTLGFRVKSPGDLTSSELDAALDSLYERTQLQEKSMLHQLQEVSKALFGVSFPTIFQCSTNRDEEMYNEKSNSLKESIRKYFSYEKPLQDDVELDERPTNTEQVIMDVRGLLSTYRDCTFTGRAVARIFQGITSPNFPALVWGRCRYWRSYLTADFYKLVEIAKQQIILMK